MHLTVTRLAALLFCGTTLPSLASEISYVNQFRNLAYTPTDNVTLSAQGAFFSASAVVSGLATDTYDSGRMTIGDPDTGPSSALTSSDGGHTFGMQTPTLPSQAAMDAQFPLSSLYTFALSGGLGTANASMDVGPNNYAAAPPMLTGNSFSALQGRRVHLLVVLRLHDGYLAVSAGLCAAHDDRPHARCRPAGTRQQLRLRVDLQRARGSARRRRRFRAADRLLPAHQRPVRHRRARARHGDAVAARVGGAGEDFATRSVLT